MTTFSDIMLLTIAYVDAGTHNYRHGFGYPCP